jgi:hypothetical protein
MSNDSGSIASVFQSFPGSLQSSAMTQITTLTSVNTTLSASQCQGIILIPVTNASIAYTLPSAASLAGRSFKFICSANGNGAGNSAVITFPGALAQGLVLNTGAAAGSLASAAMAGITTLTLTTNRKAGDSVIVSCDGTNFYVEAFTSGTSANTIAVA